ncbi:MAG TPA: M42 family metallopeptidase [Pirellulales bacterium]|jgi:endoglucanase|nr:M42 family metallopeptidase [Pirellulales bacterium]
MDDRGTQLLRQILSTPSPSGFERPVQEHVRAYLEEFADEIRTDLHGNVIAVKNPGGKLRLMLAGHCDQIGMLVQHVDAEGFIYAQTIGGWDPQVLIGQRMTLWTASGPVPGIIARKPIHLLTEEERKQVTKLKDLWIDIGAKDRADALAVVRIGDPITLELTYQELKNNTACSPAMDDKSGLWVVLEAFRRASAGPLDCALVVVSTVQEEIGLRGAATSSYSVQAQVGIAVDVTHATDCPTIDKKQEGEVKLGGGPVIYRGPNMNPVVVERLIQVAEKQSIAYQLAASGRATPTDANTMQVSRGGVATGLVSIPNRYMHSPVEMISLDDIDHTADLLSGFAASLKASDDFRP